jgi:hypothetical protein
MYFTHHERRKRHVGPKFRDGDVLFPRLISGKLPVESLRITFPPSMSSEPASSASR